MSSSLLSSLGITLIPNNLDLTQLKIKHKETLFTIPYCVKSLECPVGRTNNKCLGKCTKCSVSWLIANLEELGIDYYILTNDEEFFKFAEKNRTRYRYLFGIGCKYVIDKFGEKVHEKFGFLGGGIELLGESCKSSNEYTQAYAGGKKGRTYINKQAVEYLLNAIK